MTRPIEIPIDDDRTVYMKRRFASTLLSKFAEAAPGLADEVTGMVVSPDSEGPSNAKLLKVSFQLATVDWRELDALHQLCAKLTDSVEGFVDGDGDPVAWKRLDEEERIDVFDMDVPHATKLSMYMYAYFIKNGVDVKQLVAAAHEDAGDDTPDEDDGDDGGD